MSVKGASHSLSGPASLSTPTPAFAKPGTGNLQVIHEFANGFSMNQGKFVVTDALGVKHKACWTRPARRWCTACRWAPPRSISWAGRTRTRPTSSPS
ncbi:Uncharacterised protein [Chromobacterium violaceum]|uniref:Uncharacterized protein n=1 Tax=Chromobacterium violaceum TaxID=536 RepID=A0A3S4LG96_CHRVL|nr:Uncharacterised protein [Chromobacterium violaceum]